MFKLILVYIVSAITFIFPMVVALQVLLTVLNIAFGWHLGIGGFEADSWSSTALFAIMFGVVWLPCALIYLVIRKWEWVKANKALAGVIAVITIAIISVGGCYSWVGLNGGKLMLAIKQHDTQKVQEAVGAEKVTDERSLELFEQAIMANNAKVIPILVKHGFNINVTRPGDDLSMLMSAAAFSDVNVVKAMIENGANLRAYDKNRNTALFYAARRSEYATPNTDGIVFVLMDADDKQIKTTPPSKGTGSAEAFIQAVRLNSSDFVKIFLADPSELVELFIAQGYDINGEHPILKQTALEYATKIEDETMKKILIKHGASK